MFNSKGLNSHEHLLSIGSSDIFLSEEQEDIFSVEEPKGSFLNRGLGFQPSLSSFPFNPEIPSNVVDAKRFNPFKGTTTVSFVYQGGIVVAVDSRATSGSYIASQSVLKVVRVNDFLLSTMAGGAADCSYWERVMGGYCTQFELTYGRRISVKAASMYLSNLLYRYRGYGLSIGSMVCGWDDKPTIFYIDNDGKRIQGDLFSVGSGSTIAYGILDKEYKYDMSKEEALELGKISVYHAGMRDGASGGKVNLFHLDKEGIEKIGTFDMDKDIK